MTGVTTTHTNDCVRQRAKFGAVSSKDDICSCGSVLTCAECGFSEPLTEQVTREVAEQEGWLLGEVVYCPVCGPDEGSE